MVQGLTGGDKLKGARLRDVVQANINPLDGSISFSTNLPQYRKQVEQLNKMYAERSRKTLIALHKLGGIKDQRDKLRLSVGLFAKPLFAIDEPMTVQELEKRTDEVVRKLLAKDPTAMSVAGMASFLAEEGGSE